MNKLLVLIFSGCVGHAMAQGPVVTSWIINTTHATGYDHIPSNVQMVQYNSSNVYISADCIPGYSIGPWTGDPNTPTNQNFVYKITRNPTPNTGTQTAVGLGHTGVWKNGVSVYNALDGNSYENAGVWHQNAYVFEGSSFDACLGHPAPNGEYHHHVSPKCLYTITDSTHHSPILGYAFDGYPIYGAYAYTNTNGTGAIKRMKSSYKLRSITVRHTLPDGTTLSSSQYGPNVSTTYPLGSYEEDYVYTSGYGDLDIHNGRWCVTPDYPSGTYCYFATLDNTLEPEYPYTMADTYYGVVQSGNTGTTGGHNTITGSTTVYLRDADATGVESVTEDPVFATQIYPNPASDVLNLFIQPVNSSNFVVRMMDLSGRTVMTQENVQPTILYSFNVSAIPAGTYILNINNEYVSHSEKVVLLK